MCPGLFQAPARSTCPNAGTLTIASRITPQAGIDLTILIFRRSVKFVSTSGGLVAAATARTRCSPLSRARRGIPLGVTGFLLELEDSEPWCDQVLWIYDPHGKHDSLVSIRLF